MPAWRISRKRAILATALCLMVVAVGAGYTMASRAPVTTNLADPAHTVTAQKDASNRPLTSDRCLVAGDHERLPTAKAPNCVARRVRGQGKARRPAVHPTPTTSSTPSPSHSPGKAPTAPATTASASLTAPTPRTASPGPANQGACVTSAYGGVCAYTYPHISGSGSDGGDQTNVLQGVWNPISGASQTLTAFNPGDWSVQANMPASNKAVVAYPDIQQIYTTTSNSPNPLSGYSSISSLYTESGPSNGDYEAAYDIWADGGSQEIMIWVDNHGQTPAGSVVASATIDGVGYQIWSTNPAGTPGTPVSMVMDSPQSSGLVHILADLNWLESNGYMPAGSGVNQIDFGWEICSTAGVPAAFTLSQYSLAVSCRSGTSCTR